MRHCERSVRSLLDPFELGRSSYGLSGFLLIAFLGAGPALAAEDAGLAFVLGPDSHVSVGNEEIALPAGARIELAVDGRKSGGRYPVKVSPGGLVMPDVAVGTDGKRLLVRMGAPATGSLTPRTDGLALELAATVQVELVSDGASRSDEYELVLSTEAAGSASEPNAERGETIDLAKRSARLVAASAVSADSPFAPGEPLVVVLDGTFEGLPADLR
jgi:hypothetical protein